MKRNNSLSLFVVLIFFVLIQNSRIYADDLFVEELAKDTWHYLQNATKNHILPFSWTLDDYSGGDYCNPAEIGLLALSYIAAYDLSRAWSPEWETVESEVTAILNQLRDWQTGSQVVGQNGANAYENSLFYRWYWISYTPPVVGDDDGDNQEVPSIDNAWLAASLITIIEYAKAHNHTNISSLASSILNAMDFTKWYDYDLHQFYWGGLQQPKAGYICDYYSNENRIINFITAALGQISLEEFRLSIAALKKPIRDYDEIKVENVAWDGSIFTYLAPALFINEIETSYGVVTLNPIVKTQMKYALEHSYAAWGFSDCYDIGNNPLYIEQGALPIVSPDPELPEHKKGLVSPHASALALNTDFSSNVIENLLFLKSNFSSLYTQNGFKESVMVSPESTDYGIVSDRFSSLAQEWIFLSVANKLNGFIWKYFYQHEGVIKIHEDLFSNDIRILTSSFPNADIIGYNKVKVYGTSDNNNISVGSGSDVELINFPGNNIITIQAETTCFSVYRNGATVYFEGTDGTKLKLPATNKTQKIVFTDNSVDLFIDKDKNKVILGSQEIQQAPHPITQQL